MNTPETSTIAIVNTEECTQGVGCPKQNSDHNQPMVQAVRAHRNTSGISVCGVRLNMVRVDSSSFENLASATTDDRNGDDDQHTAVD